MASACAAAAAATAAHVREPAGSRTGVTLMASPRLGFMRCSSLLIRSTAGKFFQSSGCFVWARIREASFAPDLTCCSSGEETSSPATSQEQMQEKLRMYGERKKEQDFCIVIEPEFLDKHPEVAARVGIPAVALVSTDKVWITFMKLRLDRVLKGEISVDPPRDALAGKLTTLKFEEPEKWIAVYPKYEGDWWTPFLYKEN